MRYTKKNIDKLKQQALRLSKRVERMGNLMQQEAERIRRRNNVSAPELTKASKLDYKGDYVISSAYEISDAAMQLFYEQI